MKNESILKYIFLGIAGLLLFAVAVLSIIAAAVLINRPVLAARSSQVGNPDNGLIIIAVDPDGPAAEAGIVRGDILQAVEGEEVNSSREILPLLEDLAEGDELELNILHGDDLRTVSLTPYYVGGEPQLGMRLCCGTAGPPFSDLLPDGKDLNIPTGVLVMDVLPGTPADEAGLTSGDLILRVAGKDLAEVDLVDVLAGLKPGDKISLEVQSSGEEPRKITVELGENPDDSEKAYLGIRFQRIPHLGMRRNFDFRPEDLPFDFFHLPDMPFPKGQPQNPKGDVRAGVIVRKVLEDSPAETGGLHEGDLIVAVNGEPLDSPDMLGEKIAALGPDANVTLTIFRQDAEEEMTLDFDLGQHPDDPNKGYLGIEMGGFMIMPREGYGSENFQEPLPPFNFRVPGQFGFPPPPVDRCREGGGHLCPKGDAVLNLTFI